MKIYHNHHIVALWVLLFECGLLTVNGSFTLRETGTYIRTGARFDSFASSIDARSTVPETNIPSSVPGSSLPVPTTLSPTDSEAPTSTYDARMLQRNNNRTTTFPTVTFEPTSSFPTDRPSISPQGNDDVPAVTLSPTESDAPSYIPPVTNSVTLSPTETIAPTSESPTDTPQYEARMMNREPREKKVVESVDVREMGNTSPTSSPTSLYTGKLYSIQIEMTYDNKPDESSWALMRHPVETVFEIGFNSTAKIANKAVTVVFDDLQEGKYYFKIADKGRDGICCNNGNGKYKIIDITNGKYNVIRTSDGKFKWFDYFEFKLGKNIDYYTPNRRKRSELNTDKFYSQPIV